MHWNKGSVADGQPMSDVPAKSVKSDISFWHGLLVAIEHSKFELIAE